MDAVRNLEVYSEAYVDQIADLQAEIDAYEQSREPQPILATAKSSANLKERVGMLAFKSAKRRPVTPYPNREIVEGDLFRLAA
ncbi:MAG: hypothetical protein U0793_27755 [Gemmataceae bacterium]